MPILAATFDPAWAAILLVVDGSAWPSSVDTITITRQVSGAADITVRGVESRPVISGTFVGSDPEAPLEMSVTYRVDGYLGATFVASATVAVSTSGAANGLWIKVPGQPDLTAPAKLRTISDISAPTVGGVYQIIGGGAVSQSVAQWSGIVSERATVSLSVVTGTELARLRAALAASRVLLLQPVGSTDLDAGWYFISDVARGNPAQVESYGRRTFTLDVQRVEIPAGDGQGIPGVTWAAVKDKYATWTALMAAKATWFDVLKGL